VRREIGRLELSDRVVCLRHRADVASVLAGLDLLVLPSRREAFGMILLEAMAAGTPVIASNSGGPTEIIRNGESGLLVPEGDADALAGAIRWALDDAALRGRLAEDGRARVAEAFSRERYVGEMEALYERLVA
jgi:glycosyltransferase involved in cell wall biosynthesis